MQENYDAGYDAWFRGPTLNPYRQYSPAAVAWDAGYRQAIKDERDATGAALLKRIA